MPTLSVNCAFGADPVNTATVGVRLRGDVWARYSAEAQALGISMGTYLRRRLEEQDRVAAELAALRAAIDRGAQPARSSVATSSPATPGAIVEVLLLLRSLVGPQKSALVQKELERRGL